MQIDKNLLHNMVDAISDGATPPRLVFRAFGSLIGGRMPKHTLVRMEKTENGVTWAVLAMTDAALVSVRAWHEGAEWNVDSEDERNPEGTLTEARLIPLAEVFSVHVGNLRGAGQPSWQDASENLHVWLADWSIKLRDGSRIEMPSQKGSDGKADAFAAELIAFLSA